MRTIELLAPAKNADIGIEAICHGADAVYIGAPRFGARAAAGNSVDDIARLVEYAHFFRVRVYVALNTILSDAELVEAEKLIWRLYEVHVDALIVQDMGLLRLNLPPIPLHASTQMDNRTKDKVEFLRDAGFEQVVLARELSLDEIRDIHESCPDVNLEVFVHGALCVSLSGQCYVSEACFGRSANRGECAQVCRMEFDLEDAEGRRLVSKKHLLSLKDLCQLDVLEDILAAGAVSLKIEGRLKDAAYVKNVTAAYSRALDEICRRRPEQYRRASSGRVGLAFTPDVRKSFNRGFTHYFLYGRSADIFSFDTPKSLGEEVGRVKDVYATCFTVAGTKSFSNGDGLCFLDERGELFGFRVNKAEGGRLYPLEMPRALRPKMRLFRNFDQKFEHALAHDSAVRLLPVNVTIGETEDGFILEMCDDDGCAVKFSAVCAKELARTPQQENLRRQLSKLGGTKFELRDLYVSLKKNWFIPSSSLSEWRRKLVELMEEERRRFYPQRKVELKPFAKRFPVDGTHISYLGNVMNAESEAFYREHGADTVERALECGRVTADVVREEADDARRDDVQGKPLMFCRHCLRYSLDMCPKQRRCRVAPHQQRLYLRLANGMRFRLEFDCGKCLMKVYKD